jgi:uncharacterized protein
MNRIRSRRTLAALFAGTLAIAAAAVLLRAQQPAQQSQAPAQQPLPEGYIRLGAVTARGLAPNMKGEELPMAASRTFKVTFGTGDELLSGLTEFAEKNHITSGYITGLGGLSTGMLGWGDPARGGMKTIPVNEKSEIASLVGNVSVQDGKPRVHLHGVLSLSDGSTRGGHVIEAKVYPIAEIFIVTSDAKSAATH